MSKLDGCIEERDSYTLLEKNGVKITVRDLSDKLGINKSAVQKQLKNLQDNGYIIRVGGKSGYWQVIIVCTTQNGGTT